jgi:hypothetical protein
MSSKPVIISIPHRLGKDEARRRLHAGFARAGDHFAALLTVDQQDWSGDRLAFRARALGQTAFGNIDVAETHVRVEVTLPWLLGMLAEKLAPAIRKETVLMLEKK